MKRNNLFVDIYKMVSSKKGGMKSCCGRKQRQTRNKTQNKIGVKTETDRMLNPVSVSGSNSESDSSDSEFTDFLGGIDGDDDGGHPFPRDVENKKRFEEEMKRIKGNLKKNKRKSKKKRKRTVKRKKRKSKKTKHRKK